MLAMVWLGNFVEWPIGASIKCKILNKFTPSLSLHTVFVMFLSFPYITFDVAVLIHI